MEKRNWKHSVTLKQRMVLCLAAFFAAFALQLALNGYQARAVQQVQDDQMSNFNAIQPLSGRRGKLHQHSGSVPLGKRRD